MSRKEQQKIHAPHSIPRGSCTHYGSNFFTFAFCALLFLLANVVLTAVCYVVISQ